MVPRYEMRSLGYLVRVPDCSEQSDGKVTSVCNEKLPNICQPSTTSNISLRYFRIII